MTNILAIVGRPNVGKSTLFNRLTQTRTAIVDAVAGVTRDRLYGKSEWNGKEFSVIDTGGYIIGSEDVFEDEIRKQVKLALEEANAVLFVVDAQGGLTGMDQEVADLLRRAKKPVFLAVNKVDSSVHESLAAEFYSLGLGKPYSISAINGSGSGDLLDDIVKTFPEQETQSEDEFDIDEFGKKIQDKQTQEEELPKFAIVGRPNVGKSSFINALLGKERNIVTSIAGTTRDSINTLYNQFGHKFYLVDTAGLRKKNKVDEDLEFYSVMRSIRAIENSDVSILVLDATQGIEAQDLSIFHLIEKNKKGVVILVNKWDLVEKNTNSTKDFEKEIKKRLEPFVDVPIIFTSVKEKQRIYKAIESAVKVYHNRVRRIPTRALNDIMLPLIEAFPPPANKGKYIKIKFCTQLPTHTPKFAFFANLPQYIKEPYKRFIENKIRDNFDFEGVPIEIFIRKK